MYTHTKEIENGTRKGGKGGVIFVKKKPLSLFHSCHKPLSWRSGFFVGANTTHTSYIACRGSSSNTSWWTQTTWSTSSSRSRSLFFSSRLMMTGRRRNGPLLLLLFGSKYTVSRSTWSWASHTYSRWSCRWSLMGLLMMMLQRWTRAM